MVALLAQVSGGKKSISFAAGVVDKEGKSKTKKLIHNSLK